uniref:ATP-dependent DNA helicase n=1 Tax=Nicotiana tabacum TaxID=4097 RepID=A0A1S4AVG5_TOBAC|nr:PREDICTED: uncharacterized protein LOC107801838 [Nicotiana tabacum]
MSLSSSLDSLLSALSTSYLRSSFVGGLNVIPVSKFGVSSVGLVRKTVECKESRIALTTTTSDVEASILPGGRTAHSRFKMPIDIDDNFHCNIIKQSSLIRIIRDVKLIVWDEASMAKKNMIEALDALLRDIMDNDTMFSGKVVAFGGDFKQTLPVVRNGKKEDFIHQSLLYSEIWNKLEKLCLSENMRKRTDPSFCEYLLRIGNGTERTNCEDKIEIPGSFVIPFTTEAESLDALFSITYPDLHAFFPDSSMITSRVILTTKNDFVNEINNMLITKFPERSQTFVAVDETIEPNYQRQFEDFLHSLDPPGLLPYKLTLKENCSVILLRNLNPCEELQSYNAAIDHTALILLLLAFIRTK